MTDSFYVILQARPWFVRLFRPSSAFTVIIHLDRNTTTQGTGETINAAWGGATVMAELFHGIEVESECPFPEKDDWVTKLHTGWRSFDRWGGRKLQDLFNWWDKRKQS